MKRALLSFSAYRRTFLLMKRRMEIRKGWGAVQVIFLDDF